MNQTVKRFRCTATEVVDGRAPHQWLDGPPRSRHPLDPAMLAA
jgi:hypothetical protein